MKINFKDRSILILIAVNLYPIIGVLFLGWSAISVVAIYIIETFIIGLYNVPKMILAEKYVNEVKIKDIDFSSSELSNPNVKEYPGCMKIILIPFFLVHYNMFVGVQGVFVFVFGKHIGEQEIALNDFISSDYLLSIGFIIASHGYSFYKNYIGKKECKTAYAPKLMFLPYKRIIIQQLTVLIGAFAIFLIKAPIVFLLLLIVLKVFFDIKAHNNSHTIFSAIDKID